MQRVCKEKSGSFQEGMLYQTSKDICEKLPGKREGNAGTWPRKYGNESIFVLRKLKSTGKTEIIYNYG